MPIATVSPGVEMYYELHGEGQPLVLIMGLGGNADWWGSGFVKQLALRHKVITLDNRGASRTTSPDGDFSIEEMADDVIHLMDHLDILSADIFGVSMGGMIAQEIALRHPGHVRRLILGCTMCGGKDQVLPTPLAQQLLLAQTTSEADAMMNQARLLFPDSFIEKNRTLLEENHKLLAKHPMTRDNFIRQLNAITRWKGTYERLPSLALPTLLLHGTEDILLPIGNSHIMKDRIPNASYIEYPGCGHGFTVQEAPKVLADIGRFLSA